MKLTLLFSILFLAQSFAHVDAQVLHLQMKEADLKKVLSEIRKQTGYSFVIGPDLQRESPKLSLNVQGASLREAMEILFRNQPFVYEIRDKTVLIHPKPNLVRAYSEARGQVVDSLGAPLVGATVRVINASGQRTQLQTVTDRMGYFTLQNVPEDSQLEISYIGYVRKVLLATGDLGVIVMESNHTKLDEVIINKGYYRTSERFNTGSVGKVSANEIASQPVENPMAALQGRIAGLEVTTTTGMPGSTYNIRIRGQNSLIQGSDPLYIIDGVPVATNGQRINFLTNANWDGTSLFSLVNPSDIESIEVLKDADATAIYGSRGANGVILITTKRGKEENLTYQASIYQGWANATRVVPMLSTEEYLEMRHEAFKNDNVEPTRTTAPDLMAWDPNRYTDFNEIVADNGSSTTDAQLALSGGSKQWQYTLGGGFHRETTLTQGDQSSRRASVRWGISHQSLNNRFRLDFIGQYGHTTSNLTTRDLTYLLGLPPHIQLYDDDGSLYWGDGDVTYNSMGLVNPLAQLFQSYLGKFSNLTTNWSIAYKILKNLDIRLNTGYSSNNNIETSKNPSTTLDPFSNAQPTAAFGNISNNTWIVEPQISYEQKIGEGELSFLLGASLQHSLQEGLRANGIYYSSDALLGTIAGAGQVYTANFYELYRYGAAFGRLHYNYRDKYLINVTGRRDASSRFGPGKQFANFGAVGAAWIFSEEGNLSALSWLSLGKLRGSWGVTGNDQIGNYGFLDTWVPSNGVVYDGHVPLSPSRLYNPDFSWETNEKIEFALEFGLFDNRFNGSVAWFRNNSSTQLIQYKLPSQTGFASMLRNFDATVENSGYEITLSGHDLLRGKLLWSFNFNLSMPKNKLKSFPDLETSSYANQYVVGEPLSVKKLYRYLGVDPMSGIYSFEDAGNDGIFNAQDRIVILDTDPKFYGGLQNELSYDRFSLTFMFDFRKQLGKNYRSSLSSPPGYRMQSYPKLVMNRWKKEGDVADIQRFVSQSSSPAYRPAASYIINSDAIYSDASYIRLRNVSLRYGFLKPSWLKVSKLEFTFQAQNLLTFTNYQGGDPETQNMMIMPPLKIMTFGCNVTF